MAFYDLNGQQPGRISVQDDAGESYYNIDFAFDAAAPNHMVEVPPPPMPTGIPVHPGYPVWTFLVFTFQEGEGMIPAPDRYRVVLQREKSSVTIGSLYFAEVCAPPLTEERKEYIRGQEHVAKTVKYGLECKLCKDTIRMYAALEQKPEMEKDSCHWYQDLPDEFRCKCGESTISLRSIRENLHAVLGVPIGPSGNIAFENQLNSDVLSGIVSEFKSLLNTDPPEQVIQSYIEQRPVFFHRFAANDVLPKRPVLTEHVTDFVLLTKDRGVILVEIERASTRLVKKHGGIAAPLQHAMDQVRDWLHASKVERSAVLRGFGIDARDVGEIRGVVIAGRDDKYPKEHLLRLKAIDFGEVEFLTYDDLANGVASLAGDIRRIGAG